MVDTKWGPSPPVHCQRGVPQGAVSSPELSKPAQDPLLRVREHSCACYVSSSGRRVSVAGYVDDAEHYAQGACQLPQLLCDLSIGSLLTYGHRVCLGQVPRLCQRLGCLRGFARGGCRWLYLHLFAQHPGESWSQGRWRGSSERGLRACIAAETAACTRMGFLLKEDSAGRMMIEWWPRACASPEGGCSHQQHCDQ